LIVAVSLAAGAASLGSVFPVMAHHLLGVTMAGLALITAINLIGIAESAKVLMGPTMVFVVSIFAIIIVGFIRPHPVAVIGADVPYPCDRGTGAGVDSQGVFGGLFLADRSRGNRQRGAPIPDAHR
jgi:amino acid transporter